MAHMSIPCHEGPPDTAGHLCSEPAVAGGGRYYCTYITPIIVYCDFNMQYGDPTCTNAMADLLETSGFVQHVKSPTHECGNILDLVITSDTSQVIATAVKPTTLITDHYAALNVNYINQNQSA